MHRREFIRLLGGAAAWPLAARAQQADPMRRIGLLFGYAESDPEGQHDAAAFREGMQALGWIEGRNITIDYRWGAADPKRIQAYAAELVALKPDVILANSSLVVGPLQRATRALPIVFVNITDAVGSGFVASLAEPGGNITGFTPGEFPMFGKFPELLKEIAPGVNQMAVILNHDQSPQVGMLRAIEAVAPSLGVRVTADSVHDAADIETAVSTFARGSNRGLIVLANPITNLHRALIISLAAKYHLPAIYGYGYFAREGGLMSYGADVLDLYRRAASYVDRILKGAKPSELPVQQPTKFELVINLKTAKALGLTVSTQMQLLADEVIE